MKNLKRLFLLGGLFLLTGTAANAELVNGVRQLPEPATTAWTTSSEDTPYYLYNTSAKMFFTQGNTWGTRGCVGPVASAVKVYFSEAYDGVYYLNDYVNTRATYEWRLVCAEAVSNEVYADQRASWGRAMWTIVFTSGDGFRLQTADPLYNEDVHPTYFGRDDEIPQNYYNAMASFTDDNQRYPVSAEITEGEGHHIDWALVSIEDYEALAEVAVVYVKAQELLSYIESAKEKGINMATEQAIYENEASTIDEMNAAIEGIQMKIKNQSANDASVENPADMTASIINPGFANGINGWNGTTPAFGEGAAEFYQKNFSMYQILTNMPNGVYGVSVQAFHRTSWADYSYNDWLKNTEISAKLYAFSGQDFMSTSLASPWDFAVADEIPYDFGNWVGPHAGSSNMEDDPALYIPNDMQAASYLFGLNPENFKKTAYVAVDNGTLEIGLMKNDNNINGNWTMFDNFTLSYFGTAPEAYQFVISKGMPAKIEYSTAEVSKQYVDAYDVAYTLTASDKATLSSAMNAISAANEAITQNVRLWADLQVKYDQGLAVAAEYESLLTVSNLSGYLVDVKDALYAVEKSSKYDLDNNQLEEMISTIDNLINVVIEEAKSGIQPGTDVTEYLTNPDFENGTTGWTVFSGGGGNLQLGGNSYNHCFEAWHSTNFDVYQEVANLPMGVYEVSVQGFVRYLDGLSAIYNKDYVPENIPIYVYMNDSKTNLVNWFSYPKPMSFYDEVSGASYLYEDEENAYPDNMTAASAAFAEGGYTQTAKCLVSEEGIVTRIGVKGTPAAQYWPIFDNFRLTYLGYAVDVVKPLLEEKLDEARQHMYDMTIKYAKQNLRNTIAEAEDLLYGEDGLAMFKEIDKLNNAINTVVDYQYVCLDLYYILNDFNVFIDYADSPLQDEAYDLLESIRWQLEASELEYWEIYEKKEQIREMEIKMQLPENYAQGSVEGVDVTAFIQTPSFSKDTYEGMINAFTGWQTTNYGYNYGNDEYQRSALALEYYERSFDIYQNLVGVRDIALPKGYYRLQVNAFERVSDDTPAYLYVETSDGISMVELMKQADGFNPDEGESGPSDMVSSVEMFNEGRYLNTINFRSEGDTIRIGILHENFSSFDWIMMDNFKLFFYGDNYVEEEHNSLYIAEGQRFSTKKTNLLPISLKNKDEIVGFQFDVVLPEGMTLAKNARGKNLVTINGDRTDSHTLTASMIDDFTVRIVGTSMENEVLSGVDGVLLEMGIDVASWVPNGVYPIQLKDVKLTNSARKTVFCSDKVFNVTVGGKLGDVNQDDAIDVTDAVLIIDHILMKNPSNFDASLADVNGDNEIDVTDVVTVIDAILGKIELARGAEMIDRSAYTAFQMDLTIPAGYVLESVSLADIAKDSHRLAYNMLADGRCRVVVCSMNNEALPGAWDEVISLNLRGKGDAEVNIERAVFVTIDGERHELLLNGTTGIAKVSTFNSPLSTVYDLQGRKFANGQEPTAKGLYIVNGKKTIRK